MTKMELFSFQNFGGDLPYLPRHGLEKCLTIPPTMSVHILHLSAGTIAAAAGGSFVGSASPGRRCSPVRQNRKKCVRIACSAVALTLPLFPDPFFDPFVALPTGAWPVPLDGQPSFRQLRQNVVSLIKASRAPVQCRCDTLTQTLHYFLPTNSSTAFALMERVELECRQRKCRQRKLLLKMR